VATGLTEADATYDRLTNAVAAWSSVRKDLAEWLADTLVERITVRVDLVASLGAPLRFRIEQIVDTEPAWVAAVHLPATAGGLVELLRVCGWTLWTDAAAIDWVTGRGLLVHPRPGRPVWATYRRPTSDDVVVALLGLLRGIESIDPIDVRVDVEWCTDEENARRRAARYTEPQCESRLGIGIRRPGARAICAWCRREVVHEVSVRGGLGTHCRRIIKAWARQSGRPLSDSQLDTIARTPRIPLASWVQATPAHEWRRHLATRLP
jgi:hypothetical protein